MSKNISEFLTSYMDDARRCNSGNKKEKNCKYNLKNRKNKVYYIKDKTTQQQEVMKIYTGYYGNMKAYRGMVCVGISIGTPKWLKVDIPNCRALNPKPYMLHMEREQYTRAYNQLLKGLSPQEIVRFLEEVSGGKDVVLLCYEKPEDFCHRQLVAEWLTRNGVSVEEYFKPVEQGVEQMELF